MYLELSAKKFPHRVKVEENLLSASDEQYRGRNLLFAEMGSHTLLWLAPPIFSDVAKLQLQQQRLDPQIYQHCIPPTCFLVAKSRC
jgi:hypothetical protein